MEMFANIDKYLNEDPDAEFAACVTSTQSRSVVPTDVHTPEAPVRKKSKPKKNSKIVDADVEDLEDHYNTLKPGFGQKTAVKRFEKIRENLDRHMQQAVSSVSAPIHVDNPTCSAFLASSAIIEPPAHIHVYNPTSRALPTSSDIIDLSDSITTVPSSCDIIDLSDDSLDISQDDPFEQENYSVQVKVKWCNGPIETVPLRRYQPMADLCTQLAERHNNAPTEQILLMLKDRFVRHDECLDSVGYTIGKYISARVVEPALLESIAGTASLTNSSSTTSTTAIQLKIQSSLWKRPMVMSMEPSKTMMVLVILCAQELKCAPGRLRLRFDGEALDLNATAEDLELEGGEVIDLWMTDN